MNKAQQRLEESKKNNEYFVPPEHIRLGIIANTPMWVREYFRNIGLEEFEQFKQILIKYFGKHFVKDFEKNIELYLKEVEAQLEIRKEEGNKEVFERIEKLQDVTNPCMKCGSIQCAICYEDIENLKKEMGGK